MHQKGTLDVEKSLLLPIALLDSGDRKDKRVQKGTHGVGKLKLLNY